MRKKYTWLLVLLAIALIEACTQKTSGPPLFPGEKQPQFQVGSIQFDADIDDPSFELCSPNRIYEYYQTGARYGEGLKSVRAYFASKLPEFQEAETNHGYLTVRFVVNCKGEKAWYRTFQTDSLYQPVQFPQPFVDSVSSLVELMPDWVPGAYKKDKTKTLNSYCFITFKIREGKVIDLLP